MSAGGERYEGSPAQLLHVGVQACVTSAKHSRFFGVVERRDDETIAIVPWGCRGALVLAVADIKGARVATGDALWTSFAAICKAQRNRFERTSARTSEGAR